MEVNYTSLNHIEIGKTNDWDKYYVYCNGERIEYAQEACSSEGWVKYVVKGRNPRYEYKYGTVQILRNYEELPKFQIDFVNETVIYGGKVLKGPIPAIHRYMFNYED